MIKIGFKCEVINAIKLPIQVIETLRKITSTLDEYYGTDRKIDEDLGGYILIAEDLDDIKQLNAELYMDIATDAIPEFVDLIKCSDGQIFTHTLILCNNDFGITIIMPLEITPQNLKEYIVE